jgi:hypothetical protein
LGYTPYSSVSHDVSLPASSTLLFSKIQRDAFSEAVLPGETVSDDELEYFESSPSTAIITKSEGVTKPLTLAQTFVQSLALPGQPRLLRPVVTDLAPSSSSVVHSSTQVKKKATSSPPVTRAKVTASSVTPARGSIQLPLLLDSSWSFFPRCTFRSGEGFSAHRTGAVTVYDGLLSLDTIRESFTPFGNPLMVFKTPEGAISFYNNYSDADKTLYPFLYSEHFNSRLAFSDFLSTLPFSLKLDINQKIFFVVKK